MTNAALDAATAEERDAEIDPLAVAIALRVPVFPRGTNARAKAEQMEEFMLLSAYWQGELNEDRCALMVETAPTQDEWDALEGWEPFRNGRTDASVDHAKRTLRPDLWDRLQHARRRVRALTNEIERIERDATKVSRAYTMLAGA